MPPCLNCGRQKDYPQNDYGKTTMSETPNPESGTQGKSPFVPEEFVDDRDEEVEESYLDVELTEASIRLETALAECDDEGIHRDVARAFRATVKALTKAQERREG